MGWFVSRLVVRLSLALCLSAVGMRASWAADVAEPTDRSVGDPAVFALLAGQGFDRDWLDHGTTLNKICDIKFPNGRISYHLYWLEHLSQAAIQVHGQAELLVVSARTNILGTYDSDMNEKPRCLGNNRMIRAVYEIGGMGKYITAFSPDRLPVWLGGGSGFFTPGNKFVGATSADGITLPTPVHRQLHYCCTCQNKSSTCGHRKIPHAAEP